MNEEYVEQILKNQQAIMSALCDMYYPTNPQILANNGDRLIYNIEQTVNLLERMPNENTDRTNKEY